MATREIVKTVKNGKLYSDGCILLEKVRLSHPHLDEPYAGTNDKGEEGKPKYGVVSMLNKTHHKAVHALVDAEIKKLITANDAGKIAKDKLCLRDGDDSDKPEYEDHWTISARESRKISVRNRRGLPMEKDDIAETFYGGCFGNVLIRLWYQDGKKTGAGYGKRINCGLVAVQFFDDGEAFGEGRIDDEGVFEPIEGEGIDDDNDGDDADL